MEINKILKWAKLSRELGKNLHYVQGGGGNTSIKLSENKMLVKASGFLLKEVSETQGYCLVDYDKIRDYLKNADADEDRFSQKIYSYQLGDRSARPSMETGFHALLQDAVIHTHSVFVNLLTCSVEGHELCKQLFPEALWVPYETPGRKLTLSLAKHYRGQSLIFLENHGVIVSGEDFEETFKQHESVNKTLCDHFGIDPQKELPPSSVDLTFVKAHVFFPDQVVYTLSGEKLLKSLAAQETLKAYAYLLETMAELRLTPKFLDPKHAQELLEMESEKYRQKMVSL